MNVFEELHLYVCSCRRGCLYMCACSLLCGCVNNDLTVVQTWQCFDDCLNGDSLLCAEKSLPVPSPSGMYIARLYVDDNTLVSALTLERRTDGQVFYIGRNLRSIDIVWKQTQIGDVLIVDNQLDPDMNELFVLCIRNTDEKVVVLYKSPPIPFGERCFAWPCTGQEVYASHFYSYFRGLSEEGILHLTFSWTFETERDGSICNELEARIPLFYGVLALGTRCEKAGQKGSLLIQ